MKPHDTFLELAAMAIDFPLTSSERGRLEQHLAACDACGRTAHELRGDNLALAHLPPVTLPERRGAEILAAAMHPPVVRNPARLLVLAALLGLLLLGSLAVGSELLRRMDDDQLSVILPAPSQAASPDAGPGTGPTGMLAVTHREGDKDWIELATMDGVITRLAEGRDPAWLSPDRIVYTCPAAGEMPTGICASDVTMSPAEPLLMVAGADRPAPAPDGRSIAFHRGMVDVGETWVMGADGSNPRLVHTGDFHRWSPDGAWLAGQPESAAYEVAIVGVDGAAFRVLGIGHSPVWSRTGDRVTYAVDAEAGGSIRSVNVSDGVEEILVTATGGSQVGAPVWLPDGRLLFVQDGNVRLFDPANGASIPVTSVTRIWHGPDPGARNPLVVSPDGLWFAYATDTDAEAVVNVNNLAGLPGTPIPWTGGPVTQPAWSPAVTSPAEDTPESSRSPDGTPGPVPSAPPVSGPVVAPASLPLPSGFVSLAPAATGGVWVLVNDPPNLASESGRAVLALLATDGSPAPGWPQEIQGVDCSDGVASPASRLPLVAADGSVRILCRTASPDATRAVFALSFDAAGTAAPGWPVRLPADPVDARMVDDSLVIAASWATTDASGAVLEAEYRILRISADGQLAQGQAVAPVELATDGPNLIYGPNLAADGVAFFRWVREDGTDLATEVLAFGFDGVLPGWPVSVPGLVSVLVAGPDGRYYATASANVEGVDALAASQMLVVLTPGGDVVAGSKLPAAGISVATYAGGTSPLEPMLGSGGSVWVPGVDARGDVVVHALGPDGMVRDGWPWSAGTPIAEQGEVEQDCTGCGVWRTVPAIGPGEVLLVLLAPADATSGGQVVAVGPDGRVVDGWPVKLTNPDGRWDVVVAGADGTVYATAVEPAGARSAITLLAISPDSEVAWRSTLVGR